MTQIVNNDKLTFVLTGYGLDRVAEALSSPTVNLYLTKLKVGTGDNYEYYEPTTTQTELKGLIPNNEFPIVDKALLEDNLTVSFHAVLPETFGGYDIREIGMYETINGVDYLFAVSTQQPFVKPTQANNYLINIDYYIFLKSQNFADVYDQIELDPENKLVTKQDLENLMGAILFAQGNLIDQMGHTSEIIGLNRASQLYDKIMEEKQNFGYTMTYANYSDLISTVSTDKVFSYWVFNYPRRTTPINSITDIGKYGRNMSSDKSINLYEREYFGFMPMLKFSGTSYYYLSPDTEFSLLNSTKTEDIDFSMLFNVKAVDTENNRTLLARSNYSTGTNVFEIKELSDNSLFIRLFAGTDNYITYTSGEETIPTSAHTIIISYTKDDHNISAYLNGKKLSLTKVVTGTYGHMNSSPTTIYGYSAIPSETIYADSSSAPTALYNSDGTPNTNTNWSISGTDVLYNSVASTYTSSKNVTLAKMYTWSYTNLTETHSIYVKDATITATTKLYNLDYTEYTGTDFVVVQSGSNYIIQYLENDTTQGTDIPAKTIYAYVYTASAQYIWANKASYNVAGFTKVGSPTITSEGVASGFNSSNYLHITKIGTPTTSYEEYLRFNLSSLPSAQSSIRGQNGSFGSFALNIDNTGAISWSLSSNGTSWNIVNDTQTSLSAVVNTWYDIKLTWNGSSYTLFSSINNRTTWTQIAAVSSTSALYIDTPYYGNRGNKTVPLSTGSIDLKKISITVDGTQVFSGASEPPTVLYNSNGNLYTGTDWTISSGVVKYNTYPASYTSSADVVIPALGVSSYITDASGNKSDYINSYVGLISVMKSGLTEDQLRELSLIFQATLGQNPCVDLG